MDAVRSLSRGTAATLVTYHENFPSLLVDFLQWWQEITLFSKLKALNQFYKDSQITLHNNIFCAHVLKRGLLAGDYGSILRKSRAQLYWLVGKEAWVVDFGFQSAQVSLIHRIVPRWIQTEQFEGHSFSLQLKPNHTNLFWTTCTVKCTFTADPTMKSGQWFVGLGYRCMYIY